MTKKYFIIAAAAIFQFAGCREKKTEQPRLDNGVKAGQSYEFIDKTVQETVNIDGGKLHLGGASYVESDINLREDKGGTLTISDNVNMHKINMHSGTVNIIGAPTIRTDFNLNNGLAVFGNDRSTKADTARILVNFNISDTVWVRGGVLLVERDLNQNRGVINVSDGAEIIVKGHLNRGGTIYGTGNITVKGPFNRNAGNDFENPWEAQPGNEGKLFLINK
jgi:hypothetical protein